ncbi:MAG: hypothetical protein U0324_01225 [Polyangiales bacterium]
MRVAYASWVLIALTACTGMPLVGATRDATVDVAADVAAQEDRGDAPAPDADAAPDVALDVAVDVATDLAPDAPACTPADDTCVDVHRARACRADGTGFEETRCPDVELCLDGRCVAPACTLGARRCGEGGRPERCADGRAWAPEDPCPDGQRCASGACECAPRCDGRSCGDDGCGRPCGVCLSWQRCESARCALAPGACEPGATRPCYTGPAASSGVGRCRGGVQTCGADGAWPTACEGEVTPRVEGCANGLDDDCDGAADQGCPPTTCAIARDLGSATGPRVAAGTTVGGTSRSMGSCGGGEAPERVFIWTAPSAGAFTFTTRGSTFDTLLYLRDEGCDGRELACNDDVINGVSVSSVVSATFTRGQTVAVVVDGFASLMGDFVLNIDPGPPERCTPGARRACYTGPTGTAGVGRCRATTQPCHATGVWPDACAGSVLPTAEACANGVDDDCDGATDEGCAAVPTRVVAGRVAYEHRLPNATRTDWGALQEASAAGLAVFSLRGGVLVDSAVTGAGDADLGRFTLRVPDPATADDRVVAAALMDDGRGALSLIVGDPGGAAGTRSPFAEVPSAPRVWSWSWRADQLPADGVLRIPEAAGAGAARVFDNARRAVVHGRAASGAAGLSTAVWLAPGVAWSCGACFAEVPVRAFDQDFLSQVAYPGGPDQQWWSDAVVVHEFGHWSMGSFGRPPGEGGAHTINSPLTHGIAWSEGYASWYGATVRNDPLFVDKQRGVMFWFDIAARRLSRGTWLRTSATLDLLQPIAENEVSAVLWALAPTAPRDPLFAALASRRMTVAPFARGYLNSSAMENVPVLPDFLDALVCGGFSTARVDAATLPEYPYPSASPRCAPPSDVGAPAVASLRPLGPPSVDAGGVVTVRLAAVVERSAWLEAPVRAWIRLPEGAWLAEGPQAWAVAATPGRDERAVAVAFRGALRGDVTLTFDAQGVAMGVHGEASWPREAERAPAAPRVGGPALRLRGRSLGPSVVVR